MQLVFDSKRILKEWKKALITLIPKRPDASILKYFKLINLYTTLYKVCAKVLVSHLKLIVPHLISLEQGAFISGRCITNNVLLVQKFMHDL